MNFGAQVDISLLSTMEEGWEERIKLRLAYAIAEELARFLKIEVYDAYMEYPYNKQMLRCRAQVDIKI
jgi:hypothetical protein